MTIFVGEPPGLAKPIRWCRGKLEHVCGTDETSAGGPCIHAQGLHCLSVFDPDSGWCEQKKDRRHWKKAFGHGTGLARVAGRYIPIADHAARGLWNEYRGRVARAGRRPSDARKCAPIDMERAVPAHAYGVPAESRASRKLRDVLSVIASSRGEVSLKELGEHLTTLLRLGRAHTVRQQVVRGLQESGVVDILRRKDGRRRLVVARAPRMIMTRRGPRLRGQIVGLAPSRRLAGWEDLAGKRNGLEWTWHRSPNEFQLHAPAIEADSEAELRTYNRICA